MDTQGRFLDSVSPPRRVTTVTVPNREGKPIMSLTRAGDGRILWGWEVNGSVRGRTDR